ILSFLHHRTAVTDHRIVLISAAVGNRVHFLQWLGSEGHDVQAFSSNWRGPRRVHTIWNTEVEWDAEEKRKGKSKKYPYLLAYPLKGVLHARIGEKGHEHRLVTSEPVGEIIFFADARGNRLHRKESRPGYRALLPI